MKNLKYQLIRLGYTSPELRPHLRPLLDSLQGQREASYKGYTPYTGGTAGEHVDNPREAFRRHKKVLDYLRKKFPDIRIKFEDDGDDGQTLVATVPFEMPDSEARELEKVLNRVKDPDHIDISVDPDLDATYILIPVYEMWASIAW